MAFLIRCTTSGRMRLPWPSSTFRTMLTDTPAVRATSEILDSATSGSLSHFRLWWLRRAGLARGHSKRLREPRQHVARARAQAYFGQVVGPGGPVVDQRDGQTQLVGAARETE